jgi:hypothetical protein
MHIPRTGGTTISYILRSSFGLHHCDIRSFNKNGINQISLRDILLVKKIYPNLKSIASHGISIESDLFQFDNQFNQITLFTLIRDPINRIKKFYQYKTNQGYFINDFYSFLEKTSNGQTKKIAGSANSDKAIEIINEIGIFVGLTEKFDISLFLLKHFYQNDLNVIYMKKNISKKNEIAEKITSDKNNESLIIKYNQEDIRLYDYVTNTLFPTYCKRYGFNLETDVINYFRNNKINRLNVIYNRLYRNIIYRPFRSLIRNFYLI